MDVLLGIFPAPTVLARDVRRRARRGGGPRAAARPRRREPPRPNPPPLRGRPEPRALLLLAPEQHEGRLAQGRLYADRRANGRGAPGDLLPEERGWHVVHPRPPRPPP